MKTRLARLAAQPKRTLAGLTVVLLAGGLAVGSGANFSAQSANPSNQFTAGTLTMSNSKDNAAILTASNMKPGDSATGTVDIANTGSIGSTFSVSRTALTNSDSTNPMANKLNLVIKDCGTFSGTTAPTCDAGDPSRYTGTIAAMSSAQSLGSYAANDKHRYEFTVTFDGSAGNEYQGDSSTTTFTWDAAQ
ncbi:hypothetical protein HJD18_00975 [Thermoleophilia bacterium SCSIO 60948]|nr:hypothetical protein HJD18_00975 [Thermoleophilia bacterium SCSIO 60948]